MNDNAESPRRSDAAGVSLALLLTINLFNYIDRYILAAVEPRIAKHFFGADDPNTLLKTGSLATAFIISYMVAAPIFGWLADRMSRWVLVAIGVILWSLASGASGWAPTFAILVATRMFVGIGEAGYGPVAPTIISDLYPIERRGAKLSLFYMAIPVGGALGYAWGEVFVSIIGPETGWRWAFYAVVPPGILLGILALMRRDVRGRDPSGSRHKTRFSDYVSLLKNKSYLFDCAGMTAMTFAIGGVSFWMPHYLSEYRRVSHASIKFGLISAIAGLGATLLGGIAGDRLRRHYDGAYFLVSGAGILASCPFILLMLYLPFPLAWAAIFGAVFFLFFNTGPSNTILANVTRPGIRATAFALNIFLIHAIGDAISPPLLGKIVGPEIQPRNFKLTTPLVQVTLALEERTYHWNTAFMVVTAITAVAALLWLWGARYLAADTARASSESGNA